MRQLALSTSGTGLLGASVTDDVGCSAGELRLGVSGSDAAPRLYLGGTLRESPNNLTYGVDIDDEQRCPQIGVSSPSIAGLMGPSGAQGLAAWLERSVDDDADSCSDPATVAAVRGIGVWVVPGAQQTLLGTGAGKSAVIGATSGSRVATLALAGKYIVAFADADGQLVLTVSEHLPARDETVALAPRPPLRFGAAEHVDLIALAAEPADEKTSTLHFAAAYRTGCGDAQTVALALFRIPAADSGEPELETIVELNEPGSARVRSGPFVAYAAEGFETDSSGGWVVMFTDATTGVAMAVRVTQAGEKPDPSPFSMLSDHVDSATPLRDARGHLSFLAVERDTGRLLTGPVLCGD